MPTVIIHDHSPGLGVGSSSRVDFFESPAKWIRTVHVPPNSHMEVPYLEPGFYSVRVQRISGRHTWSSINIGTNEHDFYLTIADELEPSELQPVEGWAASLGALEPASFRHDGFSISPRVRVHYLAEESVDGPHSGYHPSPGLVWIGRSDHHDDHPDRIQGAAAEILVWKSPSRTGELVSVLPSDGFPGMVFMIPPSDAFSAALVQQPAEAERPAPLPFVTMAGSPAEIFLRAAQAPVMEDPIDFWISETYRLGVFEGRGDADDSLVLAAVGLFALRHDFTQEFDSSKLLDPLAKAVDGATGLSNRRADIAVVAAHLALRAGKFDQFEEHLRASLAMAWPVTTEGARLQLLGLDILKREHQRSGVIAMDSATQKVIEVAFVGLRTLLLNHIPDAPYLTIRGTIADNNGWLAILPDTQKDLSPP